MCADALSAGLRRTVEPQRAVKAVMWSVTAGLHHCKAVLDTKGGLMSTIPLLLEHTQQKAPSSTTVAFDLNMTNPFFFSSYCDLEFYVDF